MHKLVLLRHGESKWNLENRFTGWTDIDLSKQGINEAQEAGRLLKEKNFKFDLVYTSLLNRAKHTMKICIEEMNCGKVLISSNWRLNERHYGSLQGLNKSETAKKFGENKVLIWRRSFDQSPPALDINDNRHPRYDKKYSQIKSSELPSSESLKDTIERMMPIWHNDIKLKILANKKVLIVAHGNSIRAMVKYLSNISNDEIVNVNIPTGIPLIYELDMELNHINNYYLGNQIKIESKINSVASQGKA